MQIDQQSHSIERDRPNEKKMRFEPSHLNHEWRPWNPTEQFLHWIAPIASQQAEQWHCIESKNNGPLCWLRHWFWVDFRSGSLSAISHRNYANCARTMEFDGVATLLDEIAQAMKITTVRVKDSKPLRPHSCETPPLRGHLDSCKLPTDSSVCHINDKQRSVDSCITKLSSHEFICNDFSEWIWELSCICRSVCDMRLVWVRACALARTQTTLNDKRSTWAFVRIQTCSISRIWIASTIFAGPFGRVRPVHRAKFFHSSVESLGRNLFFGTMSHSSPSVFGPFIQIFHLFAGDWLQCCVRVAMVALLPHSR